MFLISRLAAFSLFIFINSFLIAFCHPLSFSFSHFDPDANSIVYEGDVAPSSLGTIELNTINNFFRVSRATYAEPLQLWDSANGSLADFTTNFSFTVDTLNSTYFADGLAFYLAPVGFGIPPDSAGCDLGLFNTTTHFAATSQNQIVMVEFDTFTNNEWDPPGPHVGINYNTISSVVTASWDPRGNSGKVCQVLITYNATTTNLSVFWAYGKENPADNYVDNSSSLSYIIDLRKVLPQRVTNGFSAATGLAHERHVISSWEFNSNLDSDEMSNNHKEKRKKAFLIEVVVASFFILMLGVAIFWLLERERIVHMILNFLGRGKKYSNDHTNTDLQILALPRKFDYQGLAKEHQDKFIKESYKILAVQLLSKESLQNLSAMRKSSSTKSKS